MPSKIFSLGGRQVNEPLTIGSSSESWDESRARTLWEHNEGVSTSAMKLECLPSGGLEPRAKYFKVGSMLPTKVATGHIRLYLTGTSHATKNPTGTCGYRLPHQTEQTQNFSMISESPSYWTPWSRQTSGRKVFQAERTEWEASEVWDDMTHSGERWELGLNKQAAVRSQNVLVQS